MPTVLATFAMQCSMYPRQPQQSLPLPWQAAGIMVALEPPPSPPAARPCGYPPSRLQRPKKLHPAQCIAVATVQNN